MGYLLIGLLGILGLLGLVMIASLLTSAVGSTPE